MKWKGVIFAIAGATLLAAPAGAEPPGPGIWDLDCTTDAMTDKRTCMVMYVADMPKPRRNVYGTLVFARRPDGRMMLIGSMTKLKCADKPVILRVDEKPAVTFNNNGKTSYLIGPAVADMAEQFKAGGQALMRVYVFPSCAPADLTISLKGFTAAWKRFEAEGG